MLQKSCSEDFVERGVGLYFSPATRGKCAARSENQSKTQYNWPRAEPPDQEEMSAAGGIWNRGQLFSGGDHSSPKHANCVHNSCCQYSPILYPCNALETVLFGWEAVSRAFLGRAVPDRGVRWGLVRSISLAVVNTGERRAASFSKAKPTNVHSWWKARGGSMDDFTGVN